MAFLFVDRLPQSSNRVLQASIKALEMLLLSAGLISTLVMVKEAKIVPYSCEIVFSSLLGFWNSIKCFLSSPLCICIVINFTVMLIAVSSTFHHREKDNQDDDFNANLDGDHDVKIVTPSAPPEPPPPPPPPSPPREVTEITEESPPVLSSIWPNTTQQSCNETATLSSAAALISNEALIAPNSSEERNIVNINPPTFLRKGKEVVEVKEDEVENDEEDTMEATWKAITGGGKQRPQRKQLKKSETWDVPPRRSCAVRRLDSEEVLPTTPKWRELRKSETFNDAVSITLRGGLRRDPSMSIDEFNKQVEAFIKKFNDNMRLQRQESEQRFLDNIQRRL